MSKWESETTGLKSNAWLKECRKTRWCGLLMQNGLDIDLIPFWTDKEKALEVELWKKVDAYYEGLKLDLKKKIDALSAEDRDVYFSEIGG